MQCDNLNIRVIIKAVRGNNLVLSLKYLQFEGNKKKKKKLKQSQKKLTNKIYPVVILWK